MSLLRFPLIAVGVAVGVAAGYALTKSESAKSVAVSAVRAGIKAKDWTVETYGKAKQELHSVVEEAKQDTKKEVPQTS
jgi:hypothetical protein